MLHNKWQNTILGLLWAAEDRPGDCPEDRPEDHLKDRQTQKKNLSVKEINKYILAWINLDLNLKFREE